MDKITNWMLERFALFTNISVSDNSIIDNALFLFRNIQVAFELRGNVKEITVFIKKSNLFNQNSI